MFLTQYFKGSDSGVMMYWQIEGTYEVCVQLNSTKFYRTKNFFLIYRLCRLKNKCFSLHNVLGWIFI